MHSTRIAELLQPFAPESSQAPHPWLNSTQLGQVATYVELLLRWNARINLTAVRDEESIVTRHFGESLFAARFLFPAEPQATASTAQESGLGPSYDLIDLGSGAGFPGLAIKIWAPRIRLSLIESNQKKATFLREVARSLGLADVNVFGERAERFPGSARVVTLRAVEHFQNILAVATKLVLPGGKVALLIGSSQTSIAVQHAASFSWDNPLPVPLSSNRVLLVGQRR